MPKTLSILPIALGLMLPIAALAQNTGDANGNNTSQNGGQFLQQVRKDSNNEVQSALRAEQRATNPAVQAYARLLIDDHTALISEISALEPNGNSAANGKPDASASAQSSQASQDLPKDTGAQFDRQFVAQEVQQNQQSLSSWENAAKGQGDVATFAKIGLAMQRQHLALGQAIEAQLKNNA